MTGLDPAISGPPRDPRVKPGDDAERLAAVCAEPGAISAHEIFLEQPEKILLFLRRGDAPIAAEHELADAGQIEIVSEQFAEAGLPLHLGDAWAQDLDGLLAE